MFEKCNIDEWRVVGTEFIVRGIGTPVTEWDKVKKANRVSYPAYALLDSNYKHVDTFKTRKEAGEKAVRLSQE